MHHFTKLFLICSLLLFSVGCRPTAQTASPEDYFPLILVAMEGGKTASMIGRNESLKDKNFAGCVAATVMTSAFDSAQDALSKNLDGDLVIPGFELSLEECLPLKDQPSGNPEVVPLVESIASVALSTSEFYAQRLKSTNCKKGTAALAAVAYLRGMVDTISQQIASPGAAVSLPGLAVDLDQCG